MNIQACAEAVVFLEKSGVVHHKDMGIVTDAARKVGAALPVGAVVAQLVASLRAQGDGGLDHSALLRGVERLSGARL